MTETRQPRSVIGAQNVSRMCLVCGRENEAGLKASFYELEDGELLGVFTPKDEHQGYPGRLHGGLASTILDETMGRAISISEPEVWGVTVKLSVTYRKPVPLDSEVRALGRITKAGGRLFEGAGEIVLQDGTVAVEATGTYMKLPIDRIVDGGFEAEWFPDECEAPSSFDV
jgi:uncharacterized protein (TIGR00369 family)